MKNSLLKFVPILPLLLVVGTALALSGGRQQPRPDASPTPDEGMLKQAARRAKSEGKQEVFVPGPRALHAHVPSLDDALWRFTAVIATPVESKSYIMAPYLIGTWYKFKVVERLSRRRLPDCHPCSAPPEPPAEWLPVKEDEFLIHRHSGTVVIDGVKVTSREGGFPPFLNSEKYLLFVDLDPATKIAILRMGSNGVFKVGPDGAIKHVNQNPHPFRHVIEVHGGVSALDGLRAMIKNLPPQTDDSRPH